MLKNLLILCLFTASFLSCSHLRPIKVRLDELGGIHQYLIDFPNKNCSRAKITFSEKGRIIGLESSLKDTCPQDQVICYDINDHFMVESWIKEVVQLYNSF